MIDKNKHKLLIIFKLTVPFIIGVLAIFIMGLFGQIFDAKLTIVGFVVLIIGIVVAIVNQQKGNKRNTIIILLTSGLLIGVLTLYQPSVLVGSKMFYAKHIFIYIIISILVIYFAVRISNTILYKYTVSKVKIKSIRVFTGFMVVVSLALLSQLQLYYLNNYSIPPLLSCSYYDRYNNLIYNSHYAGACPTLKDLEITDDQLSFSVHEEKFRYDDDREYKDYTIQEKYTIDTSITYTYDEQNRVIDYKINRVSQLYIILPEGKDYKLFMTETYKKQIKNVYEEDKVISTHTVYKHHKENPLKKEPYERLEADYTIELVSELIDSNEDTYYDKMIDIDYRNITKGETEYTDLYNVSVSLSNDHHYYVIKKPNEDEFVSIEKDNSPLNSITRTYSTIAFGVIETIRSERFSPNSIKLYDEPITIAQATNTHVGYRVEQNFRNESILTSEIDGSNWLTSVIEKSEFGFVIKHYSMKRESDGQYQKYPLTVDYNPGFKEYNALMDIEQINDYHYALYNPRYVEVEFIYQKNPLLFEEDFKE